MSPNSNNHIAINNLVQNRKYLPSLNTKLMSYFQLNYQKTPTLTHSWLNSDWPHLDAQQHGRKTKAFFSLPVVPFCCVSCADRQDSFHSRATCPRSEEGIRYDSSLSPAAAWELATKVRYTLRIKAWFWEPSPWASKAKHPPIWHIWLIPKKDLLGLLFVSLLSDLFLKLTICLAYCRMWLYLCVVIFP